MLTLAASLGDIRLSKALTVLNLPLQAQVPSQSAGPALLPIFSDPIQELRANTVSVGQLS